MLLCISGLSKSRNSFFFPISSGAESCFWFLVLLISSHECSHIIRISAIITTWNLQDITDSSTFIAAFRVPAKSCLSYKERRASVIFPKMSFFRFRDRIEPVYFPLYRIPLLNSVLADLLYTFQTARFSFNWFSHGNAASSPCCPIARLLGLFVTPSASFGMDTWNASLKLRLASCFCHGWRWEHNDALNFRHTFFDEFFPWIIWTVYEHPVHEFSSNFGSFIPNFLQMAWPVSCANVF